MKENLYERVRRLEEELKSAPPAECARLTRELVRCKQRLFRG